MLPESIENKIQYTDDCWLWTGSKRGGYGKVWFDNTTQYAHRVVYKILVGPIPNGLEIDHLCNIKACVNPEHLQVVTHKENMARVDLFDLGSIGTSKNHCPHGHEYSEDNTYHNPTGGRICCICWNKKPNGGRYAGRIVESH